MGIASPVRYAAAFALIATSANAAEPKINKAARAYLSLSPSDVMAKVVLRDDELETVAEFNTQPIFLEKKGLLGMVWNDNFVRAYVDKRTGKTAYQLYQTISYYGPWRNYYQVNFETPNGPQSQELTIIGHQVISCAGSDIMGGCKLSEDVAFEVPEDLLRTIMSSYAPNEIRGWRFKLKAKSAQDWQDGLSAAEVGGLLMAVDEYRASHNLAHNSEKSPIK